MHMANRKKSMSWRDISARWKPQSRKAAREWLSKLIEEEDVSLEVIKKLASNGNGKRTIDKSDPDYDQDLVDYAKEIVASRRSQSYGDRGRDPPKDGEVREYAAVGRKGAVPCVRVPLHGVKPHKGKRHARAVSVKFDLTRERIAVGG